MNNLDLGFPLYLLRRRAAEAHDRGGTGARGAGAGRGLGVLLADRLCTWCTRPVFGPVRLGTFPESIFGHCS